MEIFDIQNWQNTWGLIILVVLPVLFAALSFFYQKRKSAGGRTTALQVSRMFLIPLLMLFLSLSKIMGLSEDLLIMKILESVIILIVVYLSFQLVDYLIFSDKNIFAKGEVMPKLGRDIIHILFVVISYAFVLSHIWDLDLGNLLAALGVGSLVIGLALQEPLGNLFNGVALLMASPIKKGDWVKIDGEVGKAVEINWRSLKIHTRFNEEIIIPNNMLAKEKIINLSRPNKIFAELIKFSFSYEDKPEKVKEVLLNVATKNENILSHPAPSVYTLTYDDFSVSYGLKVYVQDFADTIILTDEIVSSVYHAAAENGITMPFPRQEIDVKIDRGLEAR